MMESTSEAHVDSTNDSATPISPANNSSAHISTKEVVTVRPTTTSPTKQQLPYFFGISGASAGSQGISMNLVIIPAGGSAKPHLHRDFETAIYLLKGRVKTFYGKGLKQSVINEAGDFLFIPPGVPHQPFNLSETEDAEAIVARNDPNEQENVVDYEPV